MSKLEIPSRRVTSVVLRYGLAVVSVAIALGLALLAQLQTVHNLEFPLFLMAIAVTVWYAGAGPGVLAVVLSSLSFNYFFTQPLYTLYIEPSDRPYFIVFMLFALHDRLVQLQATPDRARASASPRRTRDGSGGTNPAGQPAQSHT